MDLTLTLVMSINLVCNFNVIIDKFNILKMELMIKMSLFNIYFLLGFS
ncbi:hypothetical protein XBKQ1_1310003 [Xenorhabdus bovienii str. kraussei Quebec]|uniref:Uncharacterized protein n=1 Tax=Xenorhabdus bovienii str. kraussei Quebec TaxID=1398203 RepID=A0A077P278_XENBV|nr:hypothetical protein XBKQ1_1310003 [Xenorhabdus bovienii str. kraussei Quebec]